MLQVREAVQVSLKTIEELFASEAHEGLRLEEVNLDEKNDLWLVTFSYKNPDFDQELQSRRSSATSAMGFLSSKASPDISVRVYKTVKLKAEDGSFLGIKNEWFQN